MWVLLFSCAPEPAEERTTEPERDDSAPDPQPSGETGTGTCEGCDDGFSCTEDTCDDAGACIHTVTSPCPWPATDVQMLGYVDSRLQYGQSAAALDPNTGRLYVAGGSGGSSVILALRQSAGSWALDAAGGQPAAFSLSGVDLEDLILDPLGDPDVVYIVSEGNATGIGQIDLSVGGQPEAGQLWDLTPYLPPFTTSLGAEGLAFVPDEALVSGGFVDAWGNPRVSAGDFGGLFFVGHQNGGKVYVFDLSAGGGVEMVGEYFTAQSETAGLSFDEGTGRLYLWHGGSNWLEIARLSSSPVDSGRALDTELLFAYPGVDNVEGIALAPASECMGGRRRLVLVVDDGQAAAVQLFHDWPMCP